MANYVLHVYVHMHVRMYQILQWFPGDPFKPVAVSDGMRGRGGILCFGKDGQPLPAPPYLFPFLLYKTDLELCSWLLWIKAVCISRKNNLLFAEAPLIADLCYVSHT